jgi:hypothetical protein
MPEVTVTYSPTGEGWTSFWSYNPDWMIGMNSSFFTFKDGSIYKHDTNTVRNQFYGVNYDSVITTILNESPTEIKMFKTLELDSNEAWTADITTDLSVGEIADSWFVDKEGGWFGHIRRTSGDADYRAISTQGIGECQTYSSLVITFNFGIGNSVSQGDSIYKLSGGSLVLVGTVASHNYNSITLVSAISAPSPGDFIVYVKDSVAESYGARGYYAEVTITNSSQSEVEIFEISSNVFKSYP